MLAMPMRSRHRFFENDIRAVVFRPYWNVPPRILRDEVVVDITAYRNYVRDNNMEVTTPDGAVVTSGTISDDVLRQLRAGKLSVRQKPGPNNALGLLKIIFPNQHSVYLHDTPQMAQVFKSDERKWSHGCTQLQYPAELARWLLRNVPEWNPSRIEYAMHQGPEARS
jgi:murein L,D-transpeptidase YcbB/YkuD